MVEFRGWPKIARLNRDIIITEKIDGTNACVVVTPDGEVAAQSRTRIITPDKDNFGFAAWVCANADILRALLGPGYHYGEWWGAGIQRGYGKKTKTFSLFITSLWSSLWQNALPDLSVVPVLYAGPFSQLAIDHALESLRVNGSQAAPGFMRPEGIVVYHTAARVSFKVTLEGDATGKGDDDA